MNTRDLVHQQVDHLGPEFDDRLVLSTIAALERTTEGLSDDRGLLFGVEIEFVDHLRPTEQGSLDSFEERYEEMIGRDLEDASRLTRRTRFHRHHTRQRAEVMDQFAEWRAEVIASLPYLLGIHEIVGRSAGLQPTFELLDASQLPIGADQLHPLYLANMLEPRNGEAARQLDARMQSADRSPYGSNQDQLGKDMREFYSLLLAEPDNVAAHIEHFEKSYTNPDVSGVELAEMYWVISSRGGPGKRLSFDTIKHMTPKMLRTANEVEKALVVALNSDNKKTIKSHTRAIIKSPLFNIRSRADVERMTPQMQEQASEASAAVLAVVDQFMDRANRSKKRIDTFGYFASVAQWVRDQTAPYVSDDVRAEEADYAEWFNIMVSKGNTLEDVMKYYAPAGGNLSPGGAENAARLIAFTSGNVQQLAEMRDRGRLVPMPERVTFAYAALLKIAHAKRLDIQPSTALKLDAVMRRVLQPNFEQVEAVEIADQAQLAQLKFVLGELVSGGRHIHNSAGQIDEIITKISDPDVRAEAEGILGKHMHDHKDFNL